MAGAWTNYALQSSSHRAVTITSTLSPFLPHRGSRTCHRPHRPEADCIKGEVVAYHWKSLDRFFARFAARYAAGFHFPYFPVASGRYDIISRTGGRSDELAVLDADHRDAGHVGDRGRSASP